MPKILLAEDDPQLRRVVADYLMNAGMTVQVAVNGEQALACFEKDSCFDLLILDIMMPRKDGWVILSEVRRSSKVPVLILTALSAETDQLLGFDLGAQDYLTKPFSPRILVARVKALLERGKPETSTLELGSYRWDGAARKVYLRDRELSLNPKEFELLTFFMRHVGQALNREQILQGVWRNLSLEDTRTVDTHVKRLRRKLAEHGADVQTVRNYGYRFEARP